MAILAVLEGGLPACRKTTRTANLPPPPSIPQLDPTRPARAGRRWLISKLPPAAEDATAGGGRTKAGRTGGMVRYDVKQRSDNFSDT